MTLFEALKFNREPLEMLISLGGKQDDLRFIDLYTEYEVMKKQGEKTTYAVAFLANKYSVSERKVYDVIKRFGKALHARCSVIDVPGMPCVVR